MIPALTDEKAAYYYEADIQGLPHEISAAAF